MPQVTQSSPEGEAEVLERTLPNTNSQLCVECRQPLQVEATRCGHCGVSQKTWLRRILMLSCRLLRVQTRLLLCMERTLDNRNHTIRHAGPDKSTAFDPLVRPDLCPQNFTAA